MPTCKKCNESFPNLIKIEGKTKNLSSRKYCLTCSPWGKHNTKQIHTVERKKRKQKQKKIYKKCKNCDERVKSSVAIYCSFRCQQDFKYLEYIERWLSGLETGNQSSNPGVISTRVKRWLRETRGDACEKCGWNEVNPVHGKVPVQAEHKDGNAYNTVPENLELLCPNCHSLTPTFGALNRGKGRKNRK